MRLWRAVAYALRATLDLAEAEGGNTIPCSRLAAKGKMPERFLLQVLRALVAHGVLESWRGVEGGFALKRRPEEISLLEIIEAIEGPVIVVSAPMEGLPAEARGRLENVFRELAEAIRQQLAAVKLSCLLKKP
jgi:Rrf2 family protein